MSKFRVLLVVLAALLSAGCYHATIDTGLPPSPQVYHQTFASAWIYGLVPPKTVDAMAHCPNGVAKVETQMSFVNQLVGFLTAGIYTPMEIKVTCAASGGTSDVPETIDIIVSETATIEEVQQAFMTAADLAVIKQRPVYISY